MGNEGSIEPIPYDVEVAWKKAEAGKGEPPCPREAHIAVLIGRKIYIFGGGSGSTQHSDLFSFDVDEGSWTEHEVAEGQVSPPKSTGACAAAVGNSLYVFGGLNMEQEWLDELYVFDTENNLWKKPDVSGKGPSRRDKQCCCAVGKKIYFFGGFGPQEPPSEQGEGEGAEGEAEEGGDEEDEEEGPCATFGWFDDLYILNTETMTWECPTVLGQGPSARAAAALTEVNNKLYLFAGRDVSQRQNDIHELDLATMTWNTLKVSGARPIARSFHTFTGISKQHAVALGGLSSTNVLLNDVYVYDTEASAWVQPKVNDAVQFPARRFHSTTLVGQTLYVFGGSSEFDPTTNESSKFFNDMYTLSLDPILSFGPIKLPESAAGGAAVTSSGLINLSAPFQLSGDIAPISSTFSFGGQQEKDKGLKRKREETEEDGEKEKEEDKEKEKEQN